MGHFSSMFNGLARSFSMKKGGKNGKCGGRETADAMAKEAKKNDMMLCSSGIVHVDGSNNFASVFSKRGQKGVNQDCCMVWEVCRYYYRNIFIFIFILLWEEFFLIVIRIITYFNGTQFKPTHMLVSGLTVNIIVVPLFIVKVDVCWSCI